MDPMVVEVCKKYLPNNACQLDNPHVHVHYENGLKFMRRHESEYDIIIIDSPDPFGPSEGLFTKEFYGSCYKALKDDGIMVNPAGQPVLPRGRGRDAAQPPAHRQHLPDCAHLSAHIPSYAAGYWLFGFASKKYHPVDDFDAARWGALKLKTNTILRSFT